MVSQTVIDGLRPYNIGEKIRGLRLRKKMGLVVLGQHTGLSAALLSKLERGKLFPTLPTLLRIALVFSVGLEYFFARTRSIRSPSLGKVNASVFLTSRRRTTFLTSSRALIFSRSKERSTLTTRTSSLSLLKRRAFTTTRVEFLYVINGELALKVGNDEYLLDTGDSVYFDLRFHIRIAVPARRRATASSLPSVKAA